MNIVSTNNLNPTNLNFCHRPTTKLPKGLRAKPQYKPAKGVLLSLIPISLFITGSIIEKNWWQNPENIKKSNEYVIKRIIKNMEKKYGITIQNDTVQNTDTISFNEANKLIQAEEDNK